MAAAVSKHVTPQAKDGVLAEDGNPISDFEDTAEVIQRGSNPSASRESGHRRSDNPLVPLIEELDDDEIFTGNDDQSQV